MKILPNITIKVGDKFGYQTDDFNKSYKTIKILAIFEVNHYNAIKCVRYEFEIKGIYDRLTQSWIQTIPYNELIESVRKYDKL